MFNGSCCIICIITRGGQHPYASSRSLGDGFVLTDESVLVHFEFSEFELTWISSILLWA